jgi:hypothetical protein
MRQSTPYLRWVQTLERSLAGDLGVAVEGSNATIPGDDQWHTNGGGSLNLPNITPFTPKRWLEIASIGTQPFNWNISAEPFIKLSQTSGTMAPDDEDVRIYVEVDFSKVPDNFGKKSTLNISSSTDYGTQFGMPQVIVQVNKTSIPSNFSAGFVESAGQLAFEAEHYTRLTPAGNLSHHSPQIRPHSLSSQTQRPPCRRPEFSYCTGSGIRFRNLHTHHPFKGSKRDSRSLSDLEHRSQEAARVHYTDRRQTRAAPPVRD